MTGLLQDIIREHGWKDPKKTKELIFEALDKHGFTLPEGRLSIHSENSKRFMQLVVNAPKFVMDIISNGVDLKVNLDHNAFYHERNNSSAIKYMPELLKIVREWESIGAITQLDHVPNIVNPMSVSIKTDKDGNIIKYRPCLDLKRFINKLTDCEKIKYDDLTEAEQSILHGEFATSFDLENAYFHFNLSDKDKKLLNFSVIDEHGQVIFFRFNVMVYGYNRASYIMTRFVRSLKFFIHDLGILFIIFLDDGKISALTFDECAYKTEVVIRIFQLAGFNISWQKSVLVPTQTLLFQGFVTDSKNMKYFCPEDKQSKYLLCLKDLIQFHADHGFVRAEQLASVLGQLQSLNRSHGNITRVMLRGCAHELGKATLMHGWNTIVCLNNTIGELIFMLNNLSQFNGRHIAVTKEGAMTITHREVLDMMSKIVFTPDPLQQLLVSDASADTVYMYHNDKIVTVINYDFNETERKFGSGQRELMALNIFLQHAIDTKMSFSKPLLYWQTDSLNCYYFLNHGSRRPDIQSILYSLKLKEHKLQLTIIPVWTSREHYRVYLADLGSKLNQSSDEWGANRYCLMEIFSTMNFMPDVDCFATSESTICPKFFAKCPQVGDCSVNFFAQDLVPNIKYFVCPPVKYTARAFLRFVSHKNLSALFIVPLWKSSIFWPVIHDGQYFHPNIVNTAIFSCKPIIFNSAESRFSKEHVNVEFLAFLVKT